MKEAIRFSRKLSGALVIEVTEIGDDVYEATGDDGGVVVPAIEQGVGNWLIDDAYVADVKKFVASVEGRRPPMYVRFDKDGTMVEAPKDVPGDDDEAGGLKP